MTGAPGRSQVRPATLADVPGIAKIHQAAFPAFFTTLLGVSFLEFYYRLVQETSGGVCLVWEVDGTVQGFVAGTADPAVFYSALRRRRGAVLWAIAGRLLLRPWLLARLVAGHRQALRSSRPNSRRAGELSSIAVAPEFAGHGAGRALMQSFLAAMRGRVNLITLTTDANGNDAVNRFYVSLGFRLEEQFERSPGRMMNGYVLPVSATDVRAADRVLPPEARI